MKRERVRRWKDRAVVLDVCARKMEEVEVEEVVVVMSGVTCEGGVKETWKALYHL